MSVTIITLSYNKSKYVIDAIDSVLKQTHKDWTYYIIENSTDDATRKAIKSYLNEANDGRIKYLETCFTTELREKTYIPAIFGNILFFLADKEYVFFLSDDDTIHELCLESLVKYLDGAPQLGACYCRGRRLFRKKSLTGKEYFARMLMGGDFPFGKTFNASEKPDKVIDGGQVLYRRSTLEKIIATEQKIDLFPITSNRSIADHCDGIFLNKLANYTDIPPCPYNSDKFLLIHRYTEMSAWNKS